MTKEEANYVFNHYNQLLPLREKAAFKHYYHSFKLRDDPNAEVREKMYLKTGWLTSDPEILALLNNGYEQFVLDSAEKLIKNHKDRIIFNRCPKCNALARTPVAKQCRFCGYDWH
jgi:ribosomal protein L40E